MVSASPSTVLVTGGSGFVASHLILQLLAAGHAVRATLRDLAKAEILRETLRAAGAPGKQVRLSIIVADLARDEGWMEAARGCEFVQHIADSPVLPAKGDEQDEAVVDTAWEGALRVLRAARAAGVRRVVFTSSFGAVAYGHGEREAGFDERDWSVDGPELPAPQRSKLLAERAAWDFVKAAPELELAVINPVGVLGPILCAAHAASSSVSIIAGLLQGALPAVPRLSFNVVDVRDLASLHVLAMTHPLARNARFIASSPDSAPASLLDVARLVKTQRPEQARKVPARQMPDWAMRALGAVSPAARTTVRQLGVVRRVKGSKAADVLGWRARDRDEVVLATVDGLLEHRVA